MTQELTDLPAETVDVVSRWNPAATVRLRTDSGHELFVAGPRRAGKTTLVDALRFLDESAFDLVDDPLDAGVVLMVLDAAAPLGREELSVLDVVLRPACPVVFALTKTDVHREWATVRERDRALLAGHAERFADVTIHPGAPRHADPGSRHCSRPSCPRQTANRGAPARAPKGFSSRLAG
jgi:hypothetical protein